MYQKDDCFPGMVEGDNFCFRYLDKDVTANEQYLYSNYYREQISTYGTKVLYFVNAYNVLSADNLYGEDPVRKFAPGRFVTAIVELSENANTLTKFGFQADDSVTLYIHISTFHDRFYDIGTEYLSTERSNVEPEEYDLTGGEQITAENEDRMRTETPNVYETQFNQVQPKSGDVFILYEYGKGRPGERSGKQFEVSEILDQDISETNPLGGHYVWTIKAKRFEYSFQPGLSSEKGNSQMYDSSANGILSGGVQDPTKGRKYDELYPQKAINDVSISRVFNMPANTNTDVYGRY